MSSIFTDDRVVPYRFVERRRNRVVRLQFLPNARIHLWILGKGRGIFHCEVCGEEITPETWRYAPVQGNHLGHRIHERCVNQLEREAKADERNRA